MDSYNNAAPGLRLWELRAWTEKGLSGRSEADSKRVLKPDLDAPYGPRPLGGSIAAMGCVMKQI